MKYEVRILRQAQADLDEIRAFLAGESPFASTQTASAMVIRILQRIETLAQFPLRGASPRDERLRKKEYRFLVEKPYLVFYKVQGASVFVFRVLHGKRSYERIL